jgi:formate dehydrogenase iron-sulfur subunit
MASIPVTTPVLRRSIETAPSELPLLEWIKTGRTLVPPQRQSRNDERMPARAPGAGQQYRFHVDMASCIGCKCCVVACNEQNGNPASINWRRVGEIEGGWFPSTSRSYLSMGCNHCLEPTCLEGCPVDAYTKDPITGIVHHSADACIGCQYCTWNCSYGVPQYNPERGVVGKCDMCHGRLSLGETPACVGACPEGALAIEIVDVAEWRESIESAPAIFGLPAGDGSLSTTRITLPDRLPPNARPRDITHVTPEHAHWSLILMTVLTQLSVGAFVTIWLLQLLGSDTRLGLAAIVSLGVGALAVAAATFHLGRPAHAYRALRMWRRSWLSREVLAFAAFSHVAAVYAGLLWLQWPGSIWVGGLTVVLGLAGVTASACIYRVPARPAWNTRYTLVQFNLTAAILGPLFAAAAVAGATRWLAIAAASMAGAQATVFALRFFRSVASDSLELKGTARLLSTVLAGRLVLRGILLAIGAIALPLLATGLPDRSGRLLMLGALLVALAAEIIERYLFFVSVVPRHLAAPYIASAGEAA